MRTYRICDPRVEAYLLRAEEIVAEARAFSARRAILRDARRPAPVRARLGSALLVVGHRLLRSAPGSAASV